MRREVEFFQSSPRLPNGLGSPLRARQPLTRSVRPELAQLVQVDRGAIGADRDGHEIPVPGAELLQLCEELLSLGPARGPAHPLLRLARRQVELRNPRLFGLAR